MYNAIPYIIPGLIHLRKGFLVGLIKGGAYIQGWKLVFIYCKFSINLFWSFMINQIYFNTFEGGLISGGVIIGCVVLFTDRRAYNLRRTGGEGWGGYEQLGTELH